MTALARPRRDHRGPGPAAALVAIGLLGAASVVTAQKPGHDVGQNCQAVSRDVLVDFV